MSEYQYYEWQTVDRLLTEGEQESVGRLSSHIEVSSSRAVVTYEWGDFKHDPRNVLVRFFDAHLYMANWGSRRLMFRFPAGLLSRKAIEPYCVGDRIMFKTVGEFDVLDMELSEEEGGTWIEGEGSLSGLIPLWRDILQGDHRSLYLGWLKAISLSGDGSACGRKATAAEPSAPPIPSGLTRLSPSLKRFLDLFDVDPCLVEAAAEASPRMVETPEMDFRPLVAQLSRKECDDYLCRVAQDDSTAGMELKKRLHDLVPGQSAKPAARLSIRELLNRAEEIETDRKRRQKEEVRKRHEAEKDALASLETETWLEVESLVELKQSKRYDAAVQLLVKLKELSERRSTQADYQKRVENLCVQYKSRSAFQHRVREAKLLG